MADPATSAAIGHLWVGVWAHLGVREAKQFHTVLIYRHVPVHANDRRNAGREHDYLLEQRPGHKREFPKDPVASIFDVTTNAELCDDNPNSRVGISSISSDPDVGISVLSDPDSRGRPVLIWNFTACCAIRFART